MSCVVLNIYLRLGYSIIDLNSVNNMHRNNGIAQQSSELLRHYYVINCYVIMAKKMGIDANASEQFAL